MLILLFDTVIEFDASDQGQTFAGEVINNGEKVKPPRIAERTGHEIQRPTLISCWRNGLRAANAAPR
jgi:hypothetical protein